MIAVPALVYAVGAYGFFALPYTIIVYPFVFAVMPVLWKKAHANGYVTAADVVHGAYGSRALELAVALTGLVATMPYIALQLIGMEVVIKAMGLTGELPIVAAFVILALYTYSSGLRAPALIAFVKDIMIYIVVLAAVVVVPCEARRLWRGVLGRQRRLHGEGRRHRPDAEAVAVSALCDAGARLGAGGLHVSAHADRHLRLEVGGHHPQERDSAAGLYAAARPDRAARLHGLCRRHQGDVTERRGADAVQDAVPGVVRRLRVLGDRDRRAGAGGGDEHRRRQPVHPQCLEVLRQSRHLACR